MKSKWYFATDNMMYRSVNTKGRIIQKFVKGYALVLFDSKSLFELIKEITTRCSSLDAEYKRSIPLKVDLSVSCSDDGTVYKLSIYQSNDPDKIILIMNFAEVRRIEHYQTEIDFEKGTKK
jgi:hypothetical protein